MEDVIKRAVFAEEKRKCKKAGASLDIHVLKASVDERGYMTNILEEERHKPFRKFSHTSEENQKKGYFLHYCSRSGPVHQKSHRCTGCKAYVSFKILHNWPGYKVLVQRTFDHHTGHIPNSKEDGHVQKIHPELLEEIEKWTNLGVKPDIILFQAHKWAEAHGKHNIHEREYYVTPEDIHNIRKCLHRRTHLHSDDSKSTDRMLTEVLKEDVLFYQPLSEDQELIIILQTREMKKDLGKYGKNILFFDATHCVNQYGFPLFTLLARDDHGHGIPVVYIVTSSENQETLTLALMNVRKNLPIPPRCFMVDKAMSEINSIKEIFPESHILLCWYHVLQAVLRWLMRSESKLSGPANNNTRKAVLDSFRKMKASATMDAFQCEAKTFLSDFSEHAELCNYFTKNWEPISHTWANYGRCYDHGDSDTNNLVERFFHRLKYQFLGGIRNRRLDDLINILLQKTQAYFNVVKNLQLAGRMVNKVLAKSSATLSRASGMVEKGWVKNIVLLSPQIYKVVSEKSPERSYTVCPAESFCSCPVGMNGQICKHIALLELLKGHDERFPSLDEQIQAQARAIKEKNMFSVTSEEKREVDVHSLCGRGTYHASAVTHSCSCSTFSYKGICPCLVLTEQLFDNEEVQCPEGVENNSALSPSKHNNNEEIHKLRVTLRIVQHWPTVPDEIKKNIQGLYDMVQSQHSSNLLLEKKSITKSRKTRPLFPSKTTKKAKRNLNSEEGFPPKYLPPPKKKQKYKARL